MTSQFKFVPSKGLVLTIYWFAGTSNIKVLKYVNGKVAFGINGKAKMRVEKVQRYTQSFHNFSKEVVNGWMLFPTRSYDKKEWAKLSPETRLNAHIQDYLHDMRKNGSIASHKIESVG